MFSRRTEQIGSDWVKEGVSLGNQFKFDVRGRLS